MGLISNGTTLLDSGALDSGVATGSMVLLSTSTASSSATIDITSGIDSTYKVYVFKFIDIHQSNDGADFQFQVDTGTNTSYNQTITSAGFVCEHDEADTATTLATHSGSAVLHQETDFQDLGRSLGNDNDQSLNGQLYLFDPSNSSHVTHFEAVINEAGASNQSVQRHVSGYVNTTTAITRIRFKADAGTIDSGTIKMYGIK